MASAVIPIGDIVFGGRHQRSRIDDIRIRMKWWLAGWLVGWRVLEGA